MRYDGLVLYIVKVSTAQNCSTFPFFEGKCSFFFRNLIFYGQNISFFIPGIQVMKSRESSLPKFAGYPGNRARAFPARSTLIRTQRFEVMKLDIDQNKNSAVSLPIFAGFPEISEEEEASKQAQ